jgi:hypothetical protein
MILKTKEFRDAHHSQTNVLARDQLLYFVNQQHMDKGQIVAITENERVATLWYWANPNEGEWEHFNA